MFGTGTMKWGAVPEEKINLQRKGGGRGLLERFDRRKGKGVRTHQERKRKFQ